MSVVILTRVQDFVDSIVRRGGLLESLNRIVDTCNDLADNVEGFLVADRVEAVLRGGAVLHLDEH